MGSWRVGFAVRKLAKIALLTACMISGPPVASGASSKSIRLAIRCRIGSPHNGPALQAYSNPAIIDSKISSDNFSVLLL